MGRQNRQRIAAIEAGKEVSIRQRRDILNSELIRLSSERIFRDGWDHADKPRDSVWDRIAVIVGEMLPKACENTDIHQFSIADLTRNKDWREYLVREITGVLAQGVKVFGLHDRKGEMWQLKKRLGRKRCGTWMFCQFCGYPFYRTLRSTKRWHTYDCWLKDRRKQRALQIIKQAIQGYR